MVGSSQFSVAIRTRVKSSARWFALGCGSVACLGGLGVAHAAEPRATQSGSTAHDEASRDEVIEVTVQGAQGETRPASRDPSVASSVIPRARLEAPGLQAQDVLRTQPGVVVTESGGFGAPATACVRGATAADTPVYLAGLRLNDDVGGTADLSMIPLFLIQRVEIYRGNAPLEADRLGPGGAIFFEPKLPRKTTFGVGYYGGSWGTSRTWGYAGSRQGNVSYLVGVSADRASNRYPFVNDQGMLLTDAPRHTEYRRNADVRTLEGWFLGRAELGGRFTLDWVGNGVYREQGVPRLALLQSFAARQSTTRKLASLGLKGPLNASGTTELEARFSVLHGVVKYDDPLRELALRTPELTVGDLRFEQSVAARIELMEQLRLRPVLDVASESIDRTPNDIPLGRASRQFARVGTNVEYDATSMVTLRALVNGECHHTRARDRGYCDELVPTGRLGAEVRLGPARLYASAGRYLRVPTLGELYGQSGTVHGNRDLETETGRTVDFGLRWSATPGKALREVYVDAFVYSRWAEGLVAYTRTGQAFVRPYNVANARVMGAEILTGARITPLVGVEVVATMTDPRDVSSTRTAKNDILPYRSKLITSPRVRFDWKRVRPTGVSGAGGQISALYQSSRYTDPGGLVIIDEQLTCELDGYLKWFDGLLTLRGRVSDLFDAKRTDIIGYPLPGRSVYFGIEAQY